MAISAQYYQILLELQSIDFVLIDLSLYLDTHPDDTKTYLQFVQFSRRRQSVIAQFESLFGSIRSSGSASQPSSAQAYTYASTPWPWQA